MMIRTKLRAILLVLFAFIVGLVALNFYTFEKLEGDSPTVNASGSLRMHAYQLAWLSARLVPADAAEAEEIRGSMRTQIEAYDRVLAGLIQGDRALNLLPASDEAAKAQLRHVQPLWEDYRAHVNDVLAAETTEARYAANAVVAAEVNGYVAEVDQLVAAYDDASQAKIAASKKIEITVIVLALLVIGGAAYLIITQILTPLAVLTALFREVAGKEADLTQQLRAERYDEVGRIVHSFNSFVSDLRQLVQRAQACATEVSGLSDTLWQASIENSKAVECNAVAITNVAGSANEQNNDIQMLASSVAGIATHMQEMQGYAQADEINRSALITSIEAVRACAQVAAAAAEDVAAASKEITGLTLDSAAAIEQETSSLDAFAATAEQLKGLAGELNALVGRFKV